MSTITATMDSNESSSKEEYILMLNEILRTDFRSKAATMMESAIGIKTKVTHNENQTECSLSRAIKSANNCISNLESTGDSLLGSFIATSESYIKPSKHRRDPKADFARIARIMLNMMTEVVGISRRIHENALGLHVAVDFLRAPRDIGILDFSRSGRVPIKHFSCNEASTMCLTWIHSTSVQWIKTLQEDDPKISDDCIKAFLSLKDAIMHLRDSSQLACQVFRVLMYCNLEGKKILREYVENLSAEEINDIITELQTLRRKFDQINIMMEQLGWSLADIWTRFTGDSVTFETMLREAKNKLMPFGDVASDENEPEGVKNLKNKIKAGLKTLETQSPSMMFGDPYLRKPNKKKVLEISKAEQIRRDLEFKSKLTEIFGINGNLGIEPRGSNRPTGANWGKPGCGHLTSQNSKVDCNSNTLAMNGPTDRVVNDDICARQISTPAQTPNKGKMSLSKLLPSVSTPSLKFSEFEDAESKVSRNLIISDMFQEKLNGITKNMTEPQAKSAAASFNKFLRQNVNDYSFERFKSQFKPSRKNTSNTACAPNSSKKN